MPPDQVNKEKEKLLAQYSSDKGRRMFLEQYIIEELLYRKAREERLSDEKSVRDAMKDMEKSFLASRVLETAYADEINITAADVENYYKANKSRYIKKDKDGKEQQLEFDEVKDRAAMELMNQKEKEVQQKLLSKLRDKYDVVLHNSLMSGNEKKE